MSTDAMLFCDLRIPVGDPPALKPLRDCTMQEAGSFLSYVAEAMVLDGIDFDEAIASICMEMGVAYADLDKVFLRRPETIIGRA